MMMNITSDPRGSWLFVKIKFNDFQGPYKGYISEVRESRRREDGVLGEGVFQPRTHSRHISGPQKPSTRSNALRSLQRFRKSNSSTFKDLQTQIQGLSRTISVFKDFPGLENLEKKSRTIKDFQEPARALEPVSTSIIFFHSHVLITSIYLSQFSSWLEASLQQVHSILKATQVEIRTCVSCSSVFVRYEQNTRNFWEARL